MPLHYWKPRNRKVKMHKSCDTLGFCVTAQIDSGANKNSSLLEDDIPPEKWGQSLPNLFSVLEVWRWQNPTGDADVWEPGKGFWPPTEESPAFHHPQVLLGKNHWLSGIASLAWSSLGQVQHVQPTALGWALAAASVTTKHKVSPCARTVLDYLASAFLHLTTQQHPVLSISQHQESGFEGAFFVCLFTGFIWRHDIICQTRRWRHRVLNFCSGETQVQMLFLLWHILQEIKSTKINTALEQTH